NIGLWSIPLQPRCSQPFIHNLSIPSYSPHKLLGVFACVLPFWSLLRVSGAFCAEQVHQLPSLLNSKLSRSYHLKYLFAFFARHAFFSLDNSRCYVAIVIGRKC